MALCQTTAGWPPGLVTLNKGFPGYVTEGYGAEFYFYIWFGYCPFVYSVDHNKIWIIDFSVMWVYTFSIQLVWGVFKSAAWRTLTSMKPFPTLFLA